jgi:hypothetical protein
MLTALGILALLMWPVIDPERISIAKTLGKPATLG